MNKIIVGLIVSASLSLSSGSYAETAKVHNAVKVAVERAEKNEIKNWVFAQGLAQGVRREYLNFEKTGKVTFLGRDSKGRPLRLGSTVTGPEQEGKLGQLIASVDERSDLERFKEMEAGVNTANLKITQARSQLVQSENDFKLAEQDFSRVEAIWKKKLVSKKQFDQAKNSLLNAKESLRVAELELETAKSQKVGALANLQQAKVALEKNSLYAPFDGVIRTMNIRQGDYYAGPAAATTDREREASAAVVVVDTSQYEVTLNIPSYSATTVEEGQTVYLGQSPHSISVAAEQGFPENLVAKGKVYSVSPSISIDKRAIEVKVRTEQGAELLQDGMFIYAWILTSVKQDALTISLLALTIRDNKPYVFVLGEEQQAVLTPVELGIMGRNSIEVVSGIREGEQLITTGSHKLVNGSYVSVVEGQ